MSFKLVIFCMLMLSLSCRSRLKSSSQSKNYEAAETEFGEKEVQQVEDLIKKFAAIKQEPFVFEIKNDPLDKKQPKEKVDSDARIEIIDKIAEIVGDRPEILREYSLRLIDIMNKERDPKTPLTDYEALVGKRDNHMAPFRDILHNYQKALARYEKLPLVSPLYRDNLVNDTWFSIPGFTIDSSIESEHHAILFFEDLTSAQNPKRRAVFPKFRIVDFKRTPELVDGKSFDRLSFKIEVVPIAEMITKRLKESLPALKANKKVNLYSENILNNLTLVDIEAQSLRIVSTEDFGAGSSELESIEPLSDSVEGGLTRYSFNFLQKSRYNELRVKYGKIWLVLNLSAFKPWVKPEPITIEGNGVTFKQTPHDFTEESYRIDFTRLK